MLHIIGIFVSLLIRACGANDVVSSPYITSFLTESSVYSRFANVYVTVQVENDADESRTAMFSIQVPKEAFITSFSMENDGRIIHGVVKEKIEADAAYEAARQDGQTAGRISEVAPPPGRAMKNFVMYMNVAANSDAIFKLSYQELIKKVLGTYTQKIHIEPNQIVENLTVVVSLQEPQGIDKFSYTLPGSEVSLTNSISSQNTLVHMSERKRKLVYTPSLANQLDFFGSGMKGDLTIKYTLTAPQTNGGTLLVNNGAFVHFFSPSGLSKMSKTVIFVIDVSASMRGNKIRQVKVAMHSILIRLRTGDFFNIILFNTRVHRWRPDPVLATVTNTYSAISFVDDMIAMGRTNINYALVSGVRDINNAFRNRGNLVVFLTDGLPNAGESNETLILDNVQRTNSDGLVSIFCLGFGNAVRFDFLRQISLQNQGKAYVIYEDEDASVQLDDFYRGVESVTLKNIEFHYPADLVVTEDLTDTSFPNFFEGSEIVVSGYLQPEVDIASNPLTASIIAVGVDKDVTFHSTAEPETGETLHFAQRLWAYKKIKEYLDLALISSREDRHKYEQKALTLSLRYSFVTRLTSMVVTGAVNAENSWLSGVNAGIYRNMKARAKHDPKSYAKSGNDWKVMTTALNVARNRVYAHDGFHRNTERIIRNRGSDMDIERTVLPSKAINDGAPVSPTVHTNVIVTFLLYFLGHLL
ncbi:inter-alpha-trypsin inhibitor heavy chain H4-like [Ylistrum balloti]|uniref:inter-alpha-trypsin inhibitor heavy chain H4-like n=1 Tax=Ylistrum balloti TaxID=509963 RepID=UPI002905911C|nr:inter-alpha-trypsin inhibitor heavy chain H4-like [Ylistrum balloti]